MVSFGAFGTLFGPVRAREYYFDYGHNVRRRYAVKGMVYM